MEMTFSLEGNLFLSSLRIRLSFHHITDLASTSPTLDTRGPNLSNSSGLIESNLFGITLTPSVILPKFLGVLSMDNGNGINIVSGNAMGCLADEPTLSR